MKKTLLVLASALFGMSVGLSVYAADQAPAAAAPAAQAKTLGQIHGAMWPKSKDGYVTKYQCMQCHGDYDKLAKQTARSGSQSPSFSLGSGELRRLP